MGNAPLEPARFLRRSHALSIPALAAPPDWREADGFFVAEPGSALTAFAHEALDREGFGLDDDLTLLRHAAGGRGLPESPRSAGAFGFTIDLTTARRTLDGGLLLFADGSGRVIGWRAEAGTLVLWNGEDPQLTELAPGSPDRLTLIGRARAL